MAVESIQCEDHFNRIYPITACFTVTYFYIGRFYGCESITTLLRIIYRALYSRHSSVVTILIYRSNSLRGGLIRLGTFPFSVSMRGEARRFGCYQVSGGFKGRFMGSLGPCPEGPSRAQSSNKKNYDFLQTL